MRQDIPGTLPAALDSARRVRTLQPRQWPHCTDSESLYQWHGARHGGGSLSLRAACQSRPTGCWPAWVSMVTASEPHSDPEGTLPKEL